MTVDVEFLNFGTPLITSFSDTLAVGGGGLGTTSINGNWVRIPTRYNITPFGASFHGPEFNMGQSVTGGGLGLQVDNWGNGAAYFFSQAIVPRLIINSLYNLTQQFVQATWLRNSTQGCGLCAFLNLELLSGGGVSDCDTYRLNLVNSGGLGFTLTRINAGSAAVDLATNISALVSGDVIRMSVDSTNPAQTVITIKQNGVQVSQVTDNNANRVSKGWPGIYGENTNNTAVNGLQLKNFSCGKGL
jgi:hypothetical protein